MMNVAQDFEKYVSFRLSGYILLFPVRELYGPLQLHPGFEEVFGDDLIHVPQADKPTRAFFPGWNAKRKGIGDSVCVRNWLGLNFTAAWQRSSSEDGV